MWLVDFHEQKAHDFDFGMQMYTSGRQTITFLSGETAVKLDIILSFGRPRPVCRNYYSRRVIVEIWLVITVDKNSSLLCSYSTSFNLSSQLETADFPR